MFIFQKTRNGKNYTDGKGEASAAIYIEIM